MFFMLHMWQTENKWVYNSGTEVFFWQPVQYMYFPNNHLKWAKQFLFYIINKTVISNKFFSTMTSTHSTFYFYR